VVVHVQHEVLAHDREADERDVAGRIHLGCRKDFRETN